MNLLQASFLGFSIRSFFFVLACGGAVATGCGSSEPVEGGAPASIKRTMVRGVAQKGPFLSGASVTLSELDEFLAPTGRSFQAAILDDTGAFVVKNVELVHHIATLRVDGFFFNEVRGESSTSQVTLTAIVDLGANESANVNLVSHIEKGRVEYLLDQGSSFADAKKQAQEEVLAIFSFEVSDSARADELDIVGASDDDADLLALSTILLGYRSDAELSEFLAAIATDLRQDGVLDSEKTMQSLVGHARALSPAVIRAQLEERYQELGQTIELPDFESRIAAFLVEHADLPAQPLLEYPKDSFLDLLAGGADGMELQGGSPTYYELDVEGAGVPVKVEIVVAVGTWMHSVNSGHTNFDVSLYDFDDCTQTFTTEDPAAYASAEVVLSQGAYEAFVYEGNFERPAWTRKFVGLSEVIVFPDTGVHYRCGG